MRRLLTLFRYAAVALLAAGADWTVFALFGACMAAPGGIGLICARVAGGLVSFLTNRHWTWRDGRQMAASRQGRRFLVLYAGSWSLALGLFTLLAGPAGIGPWRAKLVTDILCFAVNFLAMHLYVFHRRDGLARLLPRHRRDPHALSEGPLL